MLARPLDNPLLHDLLEHVRGEDRQLGDLPPGRRAAGAARAGGRTRAWRCSSISTCTAADAIYVDFFDRPAATTSVLAALALRTGAPVVPVFALPLPGGRYRMIYEHPVAPPDPDSPDAIREFTQRCTDVLEMYVRRYPALWLWMHRRWRDVAAAREHAPACSRTRAERGSRGVGGVPAARLAHRRLAPNWLGDARHGAAGDRRVRAWQPARRTWRSRRAAALRRC